MKVKIILFVLALIAFLASIAGAIVLRSSDVAPCLGMLAAIILFLAIFPMGIDLWDNS